MNKFGIIIIGMLVPALSACGGGSQSLVPQSSNGAGANNFVGLFDKKSSAKSKVSASLIDTQKNMTITRAGTLNRATKAVSMKEFSGKASNDFKRISIKKGGYADLVKSVGKYVAYTDIATPDKGYIGVYGITGSMPTSSTAKYSGSSRVSMSDGIAQYDLNGKSQITANFGTGMVDVNINDLSGRSTIGNGQFSKVSDAGEITLKGAKISGHNFSGGKVSYSGDMLAVPPSASASSSVSGGFYGPNAQEVGGAFAVDDTKNGSSVITGAFIGKK